MDVYLVPTAADRYELYCEVRASAFEEDDEAPRTFRARATRSFRRAVEEGEREDPGHGTGQVRRFITRKLAEAVAEQRLLWNLRRQAAVRLIHPDDLGPDGVLALSRSRLAADRDKHRNRSLLNAALLALSAPFALVPGPNLLAYYFTFRTVGHFLSMRGANQGLSQVTWETAPSADLTALRAALTLPPGARRQCVDDLARALGLDKLPRFVSRVADEAP